MLKKGDKVRFTNEYKRTLGSKTTIVPDDHGISFSRRRAKDEVLTVVDVVKDTWYPRRKVHNRLLKLRTVDGHEIVCSAFWLVFLRRPPKT